METDTQLKMSKHHKKIEMWKAVSVENWMYGLEEDKKIHPTIWSEKVKINSKHSFKKSKILIKLLFALCHVKIL